MDLEEAKRLKLSLELEIQRILHEFTQNTGLTITRIEITPNYVIGQHPPLDYSVDARILL